MEKILKKKDVLNELLVDPVTYQYNKDDRRNTNNDNEITTSKTTDQLSKMVDQPEDRFNRTYNRGYSNLFFFEETSIKNEEVLKKKEIIEIIDDEKNGVEEKVADIINSITDELNEKEKFDLMKEIINKLNIKDLDSELIVKLVSHLKKNDKVL